MKKLKIFSLVVLLVVLLIAAGILLDLSNRLAERDISFHEEPPEEEGEPAAPTSTPAIILLEAEATTTVFALLEQEANTAGWAIKSTAYDVGVFIEAIGDRENGRDGSYWLYYVNNEMPMEAADKYEVVPGDKVEFRFEPSPF